MQAPRLRATGCTHEWTGREERVGSRRQKTRRTRKGCAAPGQARRAETETGDGRPRGSFWWGGREIDGGQRERNRSSLHVSKGQPLPQYVLARCLQTGCTFRRKWTRLCLDSAVGSVRQSVGPAAAAATTTVRSGSGGSDHARVQDGQATPASQVNQSVSQSIGRSRSRGQVRVEKAKALDLGRGPGSSRWRSGPA